MPSELIVPVATIDKVNSHPQADRLECCEILGWQVVIRKGVYAVGDRVVYCPPDVLVPAELAESWGVTAYLKGKKKNRVGQIRLRGEPSFGLTIDVPDDVDWEIGFNTAEYFGLEKYEPPVRPCSEDEEVGHPLFTKYTDIDNMRHFPTSFNDGDLVVITEKIHGGNVRAGCIEGVVMAGSRTTRKKEPVTEDGWKTALNWKPLTDEKVRKLVTDLGAKHKQVILFGEIYGRSLQSFDYGFEKGKGVGFRAFDLLVDGRYVNFEDFHVLCENYGVEMAPILYEGPFSLEKVKELSIGQSTMPNTEHIREGVVVKPAIESINTGTGRRLILKYLSDDYLLTKKSDFKDI